MQKIMEFIALNSEIILLGTIILSTMSVILLALNYLRTGKMIKKYNKMMEGTQGQNLEEMLTSHLKSVNKMFSRTLEIESEYKATKKMSEKSIQKVGMVRFNAFDNTGSDLSFAVALLDSFGDGVIISSIFARDETRTYAKPVQNGQSSYHLSEEEMKAIKIAIEQKNY